MMSQQEEMFQEKEKSCMAVLVPYPVDKAYDYAVPEGEDVAVGDYVLVPLGGREVTGVVWGVAAGDVDPAKVKAMHARHSLTPMTQEMRDFVEWVAEYTVTPLGSVLKMALSVGDAFTPPKPQVGYRRLECWNVGMLEKLSDKQRAVVEVFSDNVPRIAAEIAREAEVSAGVVKTLAGKGVLEQVEIFNPAPCKKPDPFREGFDLSEEQDAVAERLKEIVKADVYAAALLDGVTGAGKTEVYFEAVAQALKKGRQVLILLPEIALSNTFTKRFVSRFGCQPALWHSGLSKGARKVTWRGVANGSSKVVIGARSALFLPYQDLGLIVVDEEHDSAYKQEDGVIYHARDMAVVRAAKAGFPVVLVSATPSLETMQNVWPKPLGNGRYEHLVLPARFGGAQMPSIEAVDMREREQKPDAQHFISPALKEAMKERLARGEQVLLFLNRRGYAPLTICRSCGHRMDCPRCTAWLVEHKGLYGSGGLQCHHCGFSMRMPTTCPECGDTDSFAACGPGVERVYEEAQAYFPDAKIMMLASDSAGDQDELKKMLEEIREGGVDIIVGTQIIAKGHHFPNLTLVGVIDADLGLNGGELRAAERTYQLLHQVAGRAGRAEKPGHVMLQSFMPDHRIMKALVSQSCHPEQSEGSKSGKKDPSASPQDDNKVVGRDQFLAVEAGEREAAHMPPFSRLVGIIIAGRDEKQVVEIANALGRTAPRGDGVQVLGPAPAPFARLRGKFRYRLLVQADKKIHVQKTVKAWVDGVKCPSSVRVYIDIDPQSFF